MLGSVSERQIKRLFCSEHPQVVLINLNMLKKYIYTHILHWLGIRGNFDFKGKGKNISSFSLEERFNILSLVYKVLHVILGGRVVMNICIKLFQCGNCCILGYLIILKKKKKRITVVLSDWCLRLRKKLHWVSWDSALLLTNMVVYISVIKNSHNRLLMDFSSPKGNLNNPWPIHQNRQTHCNYWYFYVWCYQRLKKISYNGVILQSRIYILCYWHA